MGESEPRTALDAVDLDDLLREVMQRVDGVLDEQARLRLLLDAVVTMAADLSLDGVLDRILTIARTLVGARYAAVGVLEGGPGRRLRTFVHQGMPAEEVDQVGDLPSGLGLLGVITDRTEPLRIRDISEHPESYGFPPHHPPMHSFLGVPVQIRGRLFGNLYLTEKDGGGDFTPEDERIVVALAAAAGVAIENARLYEEAARREAWLEATAEITALLSEATMSPEALETVVNHLRAAADSDVAWVATGDDPSELGLRAVAGLPVDTANLRSVSLEGTLSAQVVETGLAISVPGLHETAAPLQLGDGLGWPPLHAAVVVPLVSGSRVEGVFGMAWLPERVHVYHALDERLPARFAEQAGLAIQVSRARDDQQRLAVFEDRDRIGRDLHDLVIQRLFAVGLSLQGTAMLVDQPEVTTRVSQAVSDLDATIKDLRRSIFALAAADVSADVQSEVTRLVDRAAATLKFRPRLRFEGPVRTMIDADVVPDLLAVLAEALSNASRHAEASSVEVVLAAVLSGDKSVVLTVDDDGRGLPGDAVLSGLDNIRLRAEKRGGTLEVTSSPGGGTCLRWAVPMGGPTG